MTLKYVEKPRISRTKKMDAVALRNRFYYVKRSNLSIYWSSCSTHKILWCYNQSSFVWLTAPPITLMHKPHVTRMKLHGKSTTLKFFLSLELTGDAYSSPPQGLKLGLPMGRVNPLHHQLPSKLIRTTKLFFSKKSFSVIASLVFLLRCIWSARERINHDFPCSKSLKRKSSLVWLQISRFPHGSTLLCCR